MKTSITKTTIAAALILAAAPLPIAIAATPAQVPVAAIDARYERHPEIRRAIDQLEKAKYDLQHAAHDFGGHRADALRACDAAIAQLRIALQYDR